MTAVGTGYAEWLDFEPEPDMTGDGSGDPDTHYLTIVGPDGEEVAVICHRTVGGKFPLNGEVAERKRHNAQMIVNALNEDGAGTCYADQLR